MDCPHENNERIAPIYVDGRPLYKCLDCGIRFTFEDDDQSFKGLVTIIKGGKDGSH